MHVFEHDKPYVFISYSSVNKDLVWRDADMLTRNGVNVWLDRELTPGSHWLEDEVKPMIQNRLCCGVLFYVSLPSLRSEPVYNELKYAKDIFANYYDDDIINSESGNAVERRIVPILVDEKVNRILVNTSKNANIEKIKELVTDDGNRMHAVYKQDEKVELDQLIRIIKKWMPGALLKNTSIDTPYKTPETEVVLPLPEAQPVKEEKTRISVDTRSDVRNKTADDDFNEQDEFLPLNSGVDGGGNLFKSIEYSLYGKEYNENQSNMMLRFFAQVLKRHPDKTEGLPEQKFMNCVAYTNYELGENRTKDMPSYFRVCKFFEFPNGKSVCVGTAYSFNEKLKKMSALLDLCGEDKGVFNSKNVELPVIKYRQSNSISAAPVPSGVFSYSIYGIEYIGNQTSMIYDFFEALLTKHPDKVAEAMEKISNVSPVDFTRKENRTKNNDYVSQFRICKRIDLENGSICVGASLNSGEKLKAMSKLMLLCGENESIFKSDTYTLSAQEKTRPGRAAKSAKDFLDD